jgi:hypothetical protein
MQLNLHGQSEGQAARQLGATAVARREPPLALALLLLINPFDLCLGSVG